MGEAHPVFRFALLQVALQRLMESAEAHQAEHCEQVCLGDHLTALARDALARLAYD